MENTIDSFFFFICRQIEILKNITLSRKTSYFFAPILPLSAVIINIELIINVSWLFSFLLFIPLILTFVLGRSSLYFLRGKNILLISQVEQIFRLSLKNYQTNNESLSLFFTRNSIEIKLQTKIKIENKQDVEELIFSEKQIELMTVALSCLKREIISDDTSLNDFINVIKYAASRKKNLNESIIKLQIPSDNCAYFLQSFFIPFVKLITTKRPTLLSTHKYFLFSISDEYRTLNYDSITKNSRKNSTNAQRNTYNQILESSK